LKFFINYFGGKEEKMKKRDKRLNSQESNDESRRDFLKKAGKMALYTPPAIMLLMHPSRHALACSVRPQKNGWGGPGMDGPKMGGPKFGGPKMGGPKFGGPGNGRKS
jgi:hypothetical protein